MQDKTGNVISTTFTMMTDYDHPLNWSRDRADGSRVDSTVLQGENKKC